MELSGSTGDIAQDMENQQVLVEVSLGLVFSIYDEAIEGKIKEPVVFLLDCEDQIGNQIAQGWLGAEEVSEAILDRQSNIQEGEEPESSTTVFSGAYPYEMCSEEIPQVFPYLADVFAEEFSDEGIMVVSVTSGGASVLTVPLEAREEIS